MYQVWVRVEIQIEKYSSLLTTLYGVLLEPNPVQNLLAPLRQAAGAESCILVLRWPSELDTGLILADGMSNSEVTSPENPYSSYFYKLDPFTNLPEGTVVGLDEVVSAETLESSEFYQQLLQPHGIYHILAMDILDPEGISASLRLTRNPDQTAFGADSRQLLTLLVPHLRQILRLYNQLENTKSERSLFESAVSRLSVACIIIDENRRVMRITSGAEKLLDRKEGISIRGDSLHLSTREKNRELQTAIDEILTSQRGGEFTMARAIALPRSPDRPGLGLIVRPVPRSEWFEGQSTPSVVVFISDPEVELGTSADALQALFDLTPAEARLTLLLAAGNSLDQVVTQLGISTHTGRAHLRAIFAKTGVTQQTQLVSLILRSVANLG